VEQNAAYADHNRTDAVSGWLWRIQRSDVGAFGTLLARSVSAEVVVAGGAEVLAQSGALVVHRHKEADQEAKDGSAGEDAESCAEGAVGGLRNRGMVFDNVVQWHDDRCDENCDQQEPGEIGLA
jgi:hypothetical protein